MLFDHRHPASYVLRSTVLPASSTTSALPFPSNGRVSSGESKLLTSAWAISPPFPVDSVSVPPTLPRLATESNRGGTWEVVALDPVLCGPARSPPDPARPRLAGPAGDHGN